MHRDRVSPADPVHRRRQPEMPMNALASDLRQALRTLRRSPTYALVGIGVLAVGLGASTATFTVVDRILFHPLAVADSERVVTLCETNPKMEGWCGVSPVNASDFAARSTQLTALGVARGTALTLESGREGARGVAGGIATPGFLRALGLVPRAGRLLADDDQPPRGAGNVVVVSAPFWRSVLGSDPAVVGRTLVLDDTRYTIVGVLPEGALVPRLDWVEVWMPLPFDPHAEENRDWRGFASAGRLAPGATIESARGELSGLRAELEREHPAALHGWGIDVRRMRDYLTADARSSLLLLLGAVGLLLLVVCASLSSVLIARVTARRHELAVRTALGAPRAALARHVLVEVGVLSLGGGAAGLALAFAGVRAFVALAPPGIPRLDEVALDGRAAAFCFAATLFTALVVSGIAAAQERLLRPSTALRGREQGATAAGGARLRRGLVVAEVALAVVLLAASGLLLRSFANLLAWNPGFDTDRVLLFQVFPSQGKYTAAPQLTDLYGRLESAILALPGVRAVATASAGPIFGGGDGETPIVLTGSPTPAEQAPSTSWYDVSPSYLSTLGIRLVAGRALTAADRLGAPPVALVNETLARRLWPGRSPLGAHVELPQLERLASLQEGAPGPHFAAEVVGVVADVPALEPELPVAPALFLANRQRPRWGTFFVVRTTGEPRALAPAVARAFAGVDPDIDPAPFLTLRDELATRLARPRFSATVVGVFALVSLLLGMAGVYGVVAYAVSLRRHEIGVRLALGARPRRVLREVLRGGFELIGLGAILGLLVAPAAARLLAGLLHGVRAADPWALCGTTLLLAASGLLACVVPALRASRVPPVTALRGD